MKEQSDKECLRIRDAWYERASSKDMTLEILPEFLKELAEYNHDYNTICYAVAAAAIASAWAMNRTPNGGITGFQCSAVMWEFIQQWMHMKDKPLRLVDYSDMLYPQYDDKFRTISQETADWLKKEAQKNLADCEHVHPNVIKHWKKVAAGEVPFGFSVSN